MAASSPSPLMQLASGLLDLVLAPICLGCDNIILDGDTSRRVCRRCRANLKALPSPSCTRCGAPVLATGRTVGETCPECVEWPAIITHARASCLLHPPGDRLVHQLKYRGWRSLARPMAERMTQLDIPEAHPAHHAAHRVCVPIPTTAARRRERGYNQAQLLAEEYAAVTRMECHDWLVRTSARGTQTTLQPAARAANVAGAFAIAPYAHEAVRGAHVLLVDDVLTTGATATECAGTLRAAGACCVAILTFARALDTRRLLHT